MLRVGLTGGLGSGKSTVAGMLRELGAHVIEADALGRAMMEPGHAVYDEIVRHFGREVVGDDGRLDRARLADLSFRQGRLQELNAIVHPPVVEAQQQWMDEVFASDPAAVAVIETALLFEVVRDARARGDKDSVLADWRRRIDRVVVVAATDDLKIARYTNRVMAAAAASGTTAPAREDLEADARERLKYQVSDAEKAAQADYLLENSDDIEALCAQVAALWQRLKADSNNSWRKASLE